MNRRRFMRLLGSLPFAPLAKKLEPLLPKGMSTRLVVSGSQLFEAGQNVDILQFDGTSAQTMTISHIDRETNTIYFEPGRGSAPKGSKLRGGIYG